MSALQQERRVDVRVVGACERRGTACVLLGRQRTLANPGNRDPDKRMLD